MNSNADFSVVMVQLPKISLSWLEQCVYKHMMARMLEHTVRGLTGMTGCKPNWPWSAVCVSKKGSCLVAYRWQRANSAPLLSANDVPRASLGQEGVRDGRKLATNRALSQPGEPQLLVVMSEHLQLDQSATGVGGVFHLQIALGRDRART
ncbi:hypothetical protein L916_00506 [Phytophthora nicotianae]|uniref:Uncharacterized protein n=1 Tax=Phytophthora nicotianae TaxID=4792 RepID=W2JX47_PHYNI|nr:hypothetical protein L916_00506 [Phytophthora nicotianae]